MSLPPMPEAVAESWVAFLLSLNGVEGAFFFGDSVRRNSRGNPTGTWTCDTTANTAGLQTIKINGSGSLAVNDWIGIGGNAGGGILHKVVKVVGSGNYDIWPRTRTNYGNSACYYNDARGTFRLAANQDMKWDVDLAKAYGLQFSIVEAIDYL